MIVRHITLLLRELFGYAWKNKAWWILPVVILLLIFGGLILAGESAAPFIYTLF